ncbi:FkbM family methyltransferase [Methylobacterium segetis]|uniref:FkbM family methyltransferase n=1 Tax=Methylobacterium segetis TaxID=2488750 RepID=UPI001404F227|nr:FkbM family methyltransferase [Methylobacterium segetis]
MATAPSTDAFLSRRVPLAGRMRLIHAPAGDPAFARYTAGRFWHYRQFCEGVLEADSVALDVGANIGLTALVAAETARRGRIYAIEAAPRNFAALSRNVYEHGASVIRPIHCAVGSETGTVPFFDHSAFGFVVAEATMASVPSTPVPMRRLDDIAAEAGITRLDAIKIDIEGLEHEALLGASEILARFEPVVMLEFNSWCQIASYDKSPRRFLEWLLDTFPQLHIWRDGRLTDVRAIGVYEFLHRNLTQHRCNTDLVAAYSGERLERLRAQQQGRGLAGLRKRLGL